MNNTEREKDTIYYNHTWDNELFCKTSVCRQQKTIWLGDNMLEVNDTGQNTRILIDIPLRNDSVFSLTRESETNGLF